MNETDLDLIDPPVTQVVYRGETLALKPLTVGAVPPIVRLARPVIDGILNLEKIPDDASGELVDFAIEMIDLHGEALFAAVALAIGRERDWVEGGDIGEFIDLARALVAVNRDFFVQRLAPLLRRAGASPAAAVNGAGPIPSTPSSNADTP